MKEPYVEFKGFIDKIMYKEKDGNTYLSIIDYKTGNPSIKLDHLKYGLSMQLPSYLYLTSKSKMFDNYENALNKYTELQEQYKEHLKDRALLEDEIADMQLVDREYLKIIDMLHSNNSKKIILQLDKQ